MCKSYDRLPRTVAQNTRLGGDAKVLYAVMYSFARQTGLCFASQETLARESGMTRRHVGRSIGQLIRERYIQRAQDENSRPVGLNRGERGGRTATYLCFVASRTSAKITRIDRERQRPPLPTP